MKCETKALGQASPNQASFPKFKEGNSTMFGSWKTSNCYKI